MTVVENKSCCGCGLCKYSCPQKAISFKTDNEGFIRPQIDQKICIDCGICYKTCILNAEKEKNEFEQQFYAIQTLNTDIYKKSSSGGIFGTIANKILLDDGIVFSCGLTKSNHLKIIRVVNLNDLEQLYGSKYGQSYENGSFELVKKDLETQKTVLYCALPCQVYALKSFLKHDYKNLICIDLICHGVPSFDFFSTYFNYLEFTKKIRIKNLTFRAKKIVPWGYELGIDYYKKGKLKTKIIPYFADKYFYVFSQGKNFNNCCYECKFSCLNRISDITIGDLWNVGSTISSKFSETAISVLMINSLNGKEMIDDLLGKSLAAYPIDKATVLKSNNELIGKKEFPSERQSFYKGFYADQIGFIRRLPVSKDFVVYIKYYLKRILRRNK